MDNRINPARERPGQAGKTVYYRRETLRRWLESRDAKPMNERPRMRRGAVTWWPAGRAMSLTGIALVAWPEPAELSKDGDAGIADAGKVRAPAPPP